MSEFILHNISLPLDTNEKQAIDIASKKVRALGISNATFSIHKRSIDVRKRNDPRFVYSVLLTVPSGEKTEVLLKKNGFVGSADDKLDIKLGKEKLGGRIGIIGFGPAGMFAALTLASYGYRPIVFERGGDIDSRVDDVERFYRTHELNENSNIQFGAGGAGTFSDGKLLTRINDTYCRYILKCLCEHGAPASVMTDAKPHVGTDKLRGIVKSIASSIIKNGGEIHYNTAVKNIKASTDGAVLSTENGEFFCSAAVLCPGHSARDTYSMLLSNGADISVKPFSVGVRIEHRRYDIENALYGSLMAKYRDILPHAEYALSDHIRGRGVYTFCMCPGGLVVPSSSERGGVVTNGMSYHARNGDNSNSAVAVSVTPSDLPSHPLAGVELQRRIEQAAFTAAGCDYSAPYQTVGGFLSDGIEDKFSAVTPTYMHSSVKLCNISTLFPDFISSTLRAGLISFDKKIKGFASSTAVLTAPETRTSAPIRINRDGLHKCLGLDNVYPCGEGAGYAGGITSAAVDGLKTALKLMERYAPYED